MSRRIAIENASYIYSCCKFEKYLLVNSGNASLVVHDFHSGKFIKRIQLPGNSSWTWTIRPVTRRLVCAGGADGFVSVIDMKKLEFVRNLNSARQTRNIRGIVAINSREIAVCGEENKIYFFNHSDTSGQPRKIIDTIPNSLFYDISVSPARRTLFAVGQSSYLYDLRNSKPFKSQIQARNNMGQSWGCCFVNENKIALSYYSHGAGVEVYDIRGAITLVANLPSNGFSYRMVSVGGRYVILGQTNSIDVFDLQLKKIVESYHHNGYCYDVRVSEKGEIVCAGQGREVAIFKAKSFNKAKIFDGVMLGDAGLNDGYEQRYNQIKSYEKYFSILFSESKPMYDTKILIPSSKSKAINTFLPLLALCDKTHLIKLKDDVINEKKVHVFTLKEENLESLKENNYNNSNNNNNNISELDPYSLIFDDIDDDVFNSLMFGVDKPIPCEKLYSYYLLFKRMGLNSHALLITAKVWENSFSDLVNLASTNKIIRSLFPIDLSSSSGRIDPAAFHNVFGLQILTALCAKHSERDDKKTKKIISSDLNDLNYEEIECPELHEMPELSEFMFSADEIKSKKKFFVEEEEDDDDDGEEEKNVDIKVEEGEEYLDETKKKENQKELSSSSEEIKIEEKGSKENEKEKEIDEKEFIAPKGFRELFSMNLKALAERKEKDMKEINDIKVVSSEGEKFDANHALLIFRSNFFSSMLEFGGVESEQSLGGEIKCEYLTGGPLNTLIRYIMEENLGEEDLLTLFQLLNHSHMYFERDLSRKLMSQISKVTQRMNSFEFFSMISNYGSIIENTSPFDLLAEKWSKTFKVSKFELFNIIEKAKEQKRHDDLISLVDKKLIPLQKKIGEIETSIQTILDYIKSQKKN